MLDSHIPIYPIKLRPKGEGVHSTPRLSPGANFLALYALPERGDRSSKFVAKRDKLTGSFSGSASLAAGTLSLLRCVA
jgi:hypothetical protein